MTDEKLAPLAVKEDKIALQAVSNGKAKDLAVTDEKLAPLAVKEDKIALQAVSNGKLKDLQ